MGWNYRKSMKVGPVRLTASKRGLSASSGVGPVRGSVSTTGRKTTSVRVPGTGLFWRKSKGR